jgi:hypothetical protein
MGDLMDSLEGDPGIASNGDHAATQRSTAHLAGDLVRQMSVLLHDELALAKIEMAEKGKIAGIGAGYSAGALTAAFFGLGCLTASIIAALQLVMPVWLAAMIVGVVYLAAAAIAGLLARKQMQRVAPPLPEETVATLKEDVEWIKTHAKSTQP